MTIRIFAAAALTFASAAWSTQSDAAITVLGGGLARSCFEYAEFGGDVTEGITTCTTAIEETAMTGKDLAATYINRGILKSRSDRPQTALDDYNRGISIDGNLGEAYVDRGVAMIVMQRYEEALTDIDKGIAIGFDRMQIAYYDRSIADEALGNIRAAYDDCRKAVELQPDFALAQQRLTRFRIIHNPSEGT
jgi:tetratricopeptide (TPR) repeat protein